MENLFILDDYEEEHMMRALEAAVHVRALRQFFLWTQGQLQGLLPHEIMVCIQFGDEDQIERIECLRSIMCAPELLELLCNTDDGLVVRLADYCRTSRMLPCVIEQGGRDSQHPLAAFESEIQRNKLGNAIVHGTDRLRGGSTFFAMFVVPDAPTSRHSFFLEMMLPSLHLAFQRVAAMVESEGAAVNPSPVSLLSEREVEVLNWVSQGKSNFEISLILDLSVLTIKNHMQRIFRKLKVHNRVQAVLHCHTLQLLSGESVED
jgi:transcriptional regulator EpsA